MGTKFILCANALGTWCLELEASKGKAADIEKELRAMVIAVERAQAAGITYNRQ